MTANVHTEDHQTNASIKVHRDDDGCLAFVFGPECLTRVLKDGSLDVHFALYSVNALQDLRDMLDDIVADELHLGPRETDDGKSDIDRCGACDRSRRDHENDRMSHPFKEAS